MPASSLRRPFAQPLRHLHVVFQSGTSVAIVASMIAVLLASGAVFALDPVDEQQSAAVRDGEILMPRHPAPSPDGSVIAFAYQGDLWTVPRSGGEARRLTANPARESNPIWSPDGSRIAFSSDRDGNEDVYVLPVAGGPTRRLTWDSGTDIPTDWTPDGEAVLFQSRRHFRDGWNRGLFIVRLEGGNPVPLIATGSRDGVLSPDGARLVHLRGSVSWWRTGYEGPARLQLWLYQMDRPVTGNPFHEQVARLAEAEDPIRTQVGLLSDAALRSNGSYTNLTTLASERGVPRSQSENRGQAPDWNRPSQEWGVNNSPNWFPDGEHLLYLSEIHSISNLKVLRVADGTRSWVTRFEAGRLRFPQLSRDGSTVAFEFDDGISVVDIPSELPAPGSSQWSTPPSEPKRISIRLPLDEQLPVVERVRVTSGASEMELSPDDEQIAFVHDGDLFAMKASEEEPYAYQLTFDPGRDHDISWSPDSESLVFVSDRAGHANLYTIRSSDPDEPRLCKTVQTEIVRLTDSEENEHEPRFSPDGEWISFRRGNGTLVRIRPDGSDETVLFGGWADFDHDWSPDSKWLVYARDDHDFNSDIFVMASDGSGEPINITRHPDNDYAPVWSDDGKMIAFVSDRRFPGETDVWYVRLSREDDELDRESRLDRMGDRLEPRNGYGDGADLNDEKGKGKSTKDSKADGEDGGDDDEEDDEDEDEVPEVVIDFEEIHLRLRRLTSFPGDESRVWISKDGTEFAFRSNTDGEQDLWKVQWDGTDEERLTKGGTDPRSVQWDEKGKRLYYRTSSGRFSSVSLGGGDTKSYAYEAETRVNRFQQRRMVFDEAWRELAARFYDPNYHGADWDRVRETYGPWAEAASTYHDFHDVIKMMLGELQGSHLNVRGGPGDVGNDLLAGPGDEWTAGEEGGCGFDDERMMLPGDRSIPYEPPADPSEARTRGLEASTGQLGTFFDPAYAGPGMKVLHVIPGTPADHVESKIEVGEVILSIDGVELGPDVNLYRILDRSVERRTVLEVAGLDDETRRVVLRPIGIRRLRSLLYDAEIAQRRDYIHQVSEERVAYVHLSSMGVGPLERFERDLYADAHGKDALIIDVRDNVGGWTTDLMMTSLMAADHAVTVPRNGPRGYPQDRRLLYAWSKPIVVLCNEFAFSNAEIFSWAVKSMDRGPVIGEQSYGAVISTWGTYLADGSWLRLPFRGWYTRLDGTNMEQFGCPPDIAIANTPSDILAGADPQLEAAISRVLEEVE